MKTVGLAVTSLGSFGTILVIALVLLNQIEPSYSLLAAPGLIVVGVLMLVYCCHKYMEHILQNF